MRLILACLLTCVWALPALAEKPSMQDAASSKSRAIEIKIEIDRRLREDKRLYDSILSEARRVSAERRKEADKLFRQEKSMFRHGPWSFERDYFFDAEAGPYISTSALEYSYSGGAHPNRRTTTILWNRKSGQRVSIAELFRETKPGGPTLAALAALIREDVAKEKRERDVPVADDLAKDEWLSAIKLELKTMGAPSLVASKDKGKAAGLYFHFSPYDVGAYVEGSYLAYVPWQKLEPFLTEQARALFGGQSVEPEHRKEQ